MKIKIILLWAVFWSSSALARSDILFSGRVHDSGRGIAGVAVTDGFNITHTDSKGVYSLASDTTADFVYISLPAGYDIPLEQGLPRFYVPVTHKKSGKQKIDFQLKKSVRDDTKHTMIVWADPQVAHEEELPLAAKAAEDTKAFARQLQTPVYGMVCGDITGDRHDLYGEMKAIIAGTDVPFFFTPGNHDMTLNVRSNDLSKADYKKAFGPDYYSFDRGKIHYVVLDDVFYVGRAYWYIAYLPERQLAWLQRDLASVPHGSTVVVMLHIPASSYNEPREAMSNALQNRGALYAMLKPYKTHIFSGHMHYNENFVHSDSLYEHVHAAVCAEFWQTPYCSDGTPRGYGVYEIDGSNIEWYYKAAGHDKSHQFRAFPPGANPEKPTAITVNVWNYDPAWKVRWYEDDVPKGDMAKYTGHDPEATDYINKHKETFRYKWIGPGVTEHLFFAEPASPNAKITVEVIDRFGNSYKETVR